MLEFAIHTSISFVVLSGAAITKLYPRLIVGGLFSPLTKLGGPKNHGTVWTLAGCPEMSIFSTFDILPH